MGIPCHPRRFALHFRVDTWCPGCGHFKGRWGTACGHSLSSKEASTNSEPITGGGNSSQVTPFTSGPSRLIWFIWNVTEQEKRMVNLHAPSPPPLPPTHTPFLGYWIRDAFSDKLIKELKEKNSCLNSDKQKRIVVWLWCTHIGILASAAEFVCWAEFLLVWSMEGDWGTSWDNHVQREWSLMKQK